jgi:hypothetical protein
MDSRRFQRLFNQIYVEAFLAILMIEKVFGTQLWGYAIRISKEKYALMKAAQKRALDRTSGLIQK